ncbi:molecular chaperone DnaK [Vibrio coralliilyticus]|nr:molecular chaperone DnaK [Vibrio coralliilyticus]
MTDLIDHANGTETQFTEVALANQLLRASQNAEKESAFHCQECGEQIPEARREASKGCQLCIDCQSLVERR